MSLEAFYLWDCQFQRGGSVTNRTIAANSFPELMQIIQDSEYAGFPVLGIVRHDPMDIVYSWVAES